MWTPSIEQDAEAAQRFYIVILVLIGIVAIGAFYVQTVQDVSDRLVTTIETSGR